MVFGGEAKALAELIDEGEDFEEEPLEAMEVEEGMTDILAAVQASQLRDRQFTVHPSGQVDVDYHSSDEDDGEVISLQHTTFEFVFTTDGIRLSDPTTVAAALSSAFDTALATLLEFHRVSCRALQVPFRRCSRLQGRLGSQVCVSTYALDVWAGQTEPAALRLPHQTAEQLITAISLFFTLT